MNLIILYGGILLCGWFPPVTSVLPGALLEAPGLKPMPSVLSGKFTPSDGVNVFPSWLWLGISSMVKVWVFAPSSFPNWLKSSSSGFQPKGNLPLKSVHSRQPSGIGSLDGFPHMAMRPIGIGDFLVSSAFNLFSKSRFFSVFSIRFSNLLNSAQVKVFSLLFYINSCKSTY